MAAKPCILVVRETTIIRAVWRRFFGKPFYVLGVDPWLPQFQGPLDSLSKWLLNSPHVEDLMTLAPELYHIREVFAEIYLYNVLQRIEPWQNKFFRFDVAERKIPDYAMAYKNVVCNYMRLKYLQILTLNATLPNFEPDEITVVGVDSSTLGALETYAGKSFGNFMNLPFGAHKPVVNFFILIAVTVATVAWILYRTRPWAPRPEHFFFAADFIGDVRDLRMYEEVNDGGPVLLVARYSPEKQGNMELPKAHRLCTMKDGRFGIPGALDALGFVFAHGAKLFRLFRNTEPGFFYQICSLPYRRAVLRAFFNRFDTRYYWGRDEYNSDHIIRTQELNRVGNRSLGILHSTLHYALYFPMWRYISCNLFYVFGRSVHEHLKDTWDNSMTVKAVGSFGGRREDYPRINQTRPKDIAVFAAILTGYPEFVNLVRRLAEAFPDRKIILQLKPNYARLTRGKDFAKACTSGLSNVVLSDDPVFEIFSKARYAFSDPSACVSEALQFGMMAFMADLCDFQEASIYRNFPGLCVTSADEAVKRIRDIESGAWEYPRRSYGDLVDLSGQVFFDVLRQDIGLAPRENSENSRELNAP